MDKNKITAVLGPTNTGKTHLAIETMLSFENGMIGFPLRLLAREVYDKVIQKTSLDKVALITGEEKLFLIMQNIFYVLLSQCRLINTWILLELMKFKCVQIMKEDISSLTDY